MDENVWPAVVRRDEAKALILREKFNCTVCHSVLDCWLRRYRLVGPFKKYHDFGPDWEVSITRASWNPLQVN